MSAPKRSCLVNTRVFLWHDSSQQQGRFKGRIVQQEKVAYIYRRDQDLSGAGMIRKQNISQWKRQMQVTDMENIGQAIGRWCGELGSPNAFYVTRGWVARCASQSAGFGVGNMTHRLVPKHFAK